MIRTLISLMIVAVFSVRNGQAQYAYFATRGTIHYDKVTYTKAKMRDMMSEMTQRGNNRGGMFGGNTDNMPESTTQKYILYFDENGSLMRSADSTASATNNAGRQGTIRVNAGSPGGQGAGRAGGNSRFSVNGNAGNIRVGGMGVRSGQQKILYQNIKNNTAEIQFEADDKYLLSDSLNQVTWRFTDEYRNIAGFNCRRVNGATADSLYLIAYYTDEIPLSAGPALSHGLPGMILGLVIPEMHIQYWATAVDYGNNLTPTDWKDKKAKKMTADEFSKSFGRFMPRVRAASSDKSRLLENLLYQ